MRATLSISHMAKCPNYLPNDTMAAWHLGSMAAWTSRHKRKGGGGDGLVGMMRISFDVRFGIYRCSTEGGFWL